MDLIKNILYADDDPLTRDILQKVLQASGYHVLLAENGKKAIQILQARTVDLVLLDIMMPGLDGYQTCRAIRAFSAVPIIFLSAMGEEDDLVCGFQAGAYDYIIKPFRPRELIARIEAVLQRAQPAPVNDYILTHKDLTLNLRSHEASLRGKSLNLSPTSFQLLEYFMRNTGALLTKSALLHSVWESAHPIQGENMVEAAIKRLRRELGDDPREPKYIHTVWGRGYRFGD
jgi:DNA-binding response OmpR family regulator